MGHYPRRQIRLSRRNALSKLLKKLLPRLPMARLCVPRVEVLTDFLEKGYSDWLAPDREDAPGEVEEVKNIEILPRRECSVYPVIDRRLFIGTNSFARKEYFRYLPQSRLVQRTFNIGKGYGPVLYFDAEDELSGLVETLQIGGLTGRLVARVDSGAIDLCEDAEMNTNRVEKSARKRLEIRSPPDFSFRNSAEMFSVSSKLTRGGTGYENFRLCCRRNISSRTWRNRAVVN